MRIPTCQGVLLLFSYVANVVTMRLSVAKCGNYGYINRYVVIIGLTGVSDMTALRDLDV